VIERGVRCRLSWRSAAERDRAGSEAHTRRQRERKRTRVMDGCLCPGRTEQQKIYGETEGQNIGGRQKINLGLPGGECNNLVS